MNKLIDLIKKIFTKIKLSKINFLNKKFKKYIIKYQIENSKIKITNSNGDFKIVDNTVPNKVKVMEIIKEHEKEIDRRIMNYENVKEDKKIIIMSSGLLLCFLGVLLIFSFFVGNFVLFYLAVISFSISLTLFLINTYKILIDREEIKRLKLIRDNKDIYESDELKEIFVDSLSYIKNYFYELVEKIKKIFEKNKSKI